MSTSDPSPVTPQHKTFARGVNHSLGLGFALLITLMAVLVAHAIWHISNLEDRMHSIVEVLNRKIQLATDLQEATYNRHAALVYQTLSSDPFERDDSFQLYIKWGYLVGKARNELKAMPLGSFEKANLMLQDQLIAKIIVLQEDISDLSSRNKIAQAHAVMATRLRPLNLQFTDMVERLRIYERDQIRSALESTQHATRNTITVHMMLGGALVLLAIVIGLTTKKLLTRHTRTICQQMSELEEVGHRLEHEATHDPLTGLANRALFHRRMGENLTHAREDKFQLAVMYLDLDDFKPVNDTYGHAVGDALLREVATRLRQLVRVSDTVARLGGDEFAIILTGLEDAEQCTVLKHKIETELARPLRVDDVELRPHGSIGYVLFPGDGDTLDQLLSTADARMYECKRARKEARATAQRTTQEPVATAPLPAP